MCRAASPTRSIEQISSRLHLLLAAAHLRGRASGTPLVRTGITTETGENVHLRDLRRQDLPQAPVSRPAVFPTTPRSPLRLRRWPC